MRKKSEFPKDFFSRKMPNVSLKEALKDVAPINWNKKDDEDIIVYSVSEKESKYNKKNIK